jgi:hypothetical protein
MFYIVKPTEPEIVVDPADDIVSVTPETKKKPDDRSEPSGGSVDGDGSQMGQEEAAEESSEDDENH